MILFVIIYTPQYQNLFKLKSIWSTRKLAEIAINIHSKKEGLTNEYIIIELPLDIIVN